MTDSFEPHVSPRESPAEFTPRAVVLGALLGVVFGAASVYLALKVGLTTSASVPIAVLSIAILKKLGRSTILENNMVQTVGSAGESIAAAVVFTVPAVLFLGGELDYLRTLLIALLGGVLGVLMMIPLRRFLIVQEHGKLRFPEGTACAEILKSGESGVTSASKIFAGLGAGALYKACAYIGGFWKYSVARDLTFFRGSSVALEASPELLGVGYIIGWRTSVVMVAGSLLSAFVLGPTIAFFGEAAAAPIAPEANALVKDMTPDGIWGSYVRYIGAGAVAAGGIVGLLRALPSIVASLTAVGRKLGALGARGAAQDVPRTERDTPIAIVVLGSLALVATIVLVPSFHMNVFGAVLILVFGFLFSAVSARITGLVGSSSCPLSGMTIAVLMGTCLLFLAAGWTGKEYWILALTVGAIVCIAISNAGTTAQDLKTGHLVGATPRAQQMGLLVGVVTSAVVVGLTLVLLNDSRSDFEPLAAPAAPSAEHVRVLREDLSVKGQGGFREVSVKGDGAVPDGRYLLDASGAAAMRRVDAIGQKEKFPAPQARLMATVIQGLLDHKLPWHLIGIGVAIALFMELLGIHSLTFAVGVYLPLSSTAPIFVGGAVRALADKLYKRTPDDVEEREGTLFSSGLIAGGALLGVCAALLGLLRELGPAWDMDVGEFDALDPEGLNALPRRIALGPRLWPALFESPLPTLLVFAALGYALLRAARDPKPSAP